MNNITSTLFVLLVLFFVFKITFSSSLIIKSFTKYGPERNKLYVEMYNTNNARLFIVKPMDWIFLNEQRRLFFIDKTTESKYCAVKFNEFYLLNNTFILAREFCKDINYANQIIDNYTVLDKVRKTVNVLNIDLQDIPDSPVNILSVLNYLYNNGYLLYR